MQPHTDIIDTTTNKLDVNRESRFCHDFETAIQTNDKPFYNLLMSMISTDTTDLDEFNQYQSPELELANDVYKQFFTKPKQLVGDYDQFVELNCNDFAHRGSVPSIKLLQELRVQPLSPTEPSTIPSDVLSNLDFNIQQKWKIQQQRQDSEKLETEDRKPKLDIESWFNTLKQSRVLAGYRDETAAKLTHLASA